MEQEDRRVIGECFGSTVVGPRGQLVIPVEARRGLGIDVGTKLLVFSQFQGRGLTFVKVGAIEDLLNTMSSRVNEFARILRETETADPGIADEGNRS
jgi:bifunctional DNA-binding transcriptional regulator/antitoxin component of YhaV-PrlF toxin-antitoxin module